MLIIDRHIISQALKILAIVMVTVIGIYLVVDFFEKIDDFNEQNVPMGRALTFFMYQLPFIIAQVAPIVILLSVLVALGIMNRQNEIIALKSSGVSSYYIIRPVFFMGIIFSLLLFWVSELVVPFTSARANQIWMKEVRNKSAVVVKDRNIWLRGKNTISNIGYFDSQQKIIHDVSICFFDDQFNLIRRVDAAKGAYQKKNGWRLTEVLEQRRDNASGEFSVVHHDVYIEKADFGPSDLRRVIKRSEEMGFWELLKFIRKSRTEGYDSLRLTVDLHNKIAYPFACLVLCLLGVGIAARPKAKDALPLSVGLGLLTVFVFWVFHSFCVSLGYGGMLPPLVATWISNLAFLFVGALIILQTE
jgi:lipopolysaccharide export system permease protein